MEIKKIRYPSPHPEIHAYLVTYKSQGLIVKGFLLEPTWANSFPGLLYLRGGIRRVGMVRMARIIEFASYGFIVFAPFYRGNFGGEGWEDFAGDDIYDAINGFNVLNSHPKVEKDHIHAFGFSRGGLMAMLTAAHVSQLCSVVTWSGVSDMVLAYEERVDLRRMLKRVIGGTPRKYPERYLARTPLVMIDAIESPVLIIHGKEDQNVSIDHAYKLRDELLKKGKQVTCWLFDHYPHQFPEREKHNVTKQCIEWMKQKQNTL